MTLTPEDALEVCRKIRMDLTNAQAKLTDVIEALAAIPTPPNTTRICPTCGITTRGPNRLAEHIYTSHEGPVPDHYIRAEQLAGYE